MYPLNSLIWRHFTRLIFSYNWIYCRLEKWKETDSLVQSSICLISTPSLTVICSEGEGGGGGVGHLFSNYAVWNNHGGDISKSDLLSRRCGAQRNGVDGRTGWAAAFSPAVVVTAAATDNTHTGQQMWRLCPLLLNWLLFIRPECFGKWHESSLM